MTKKEVINELELKYAAEHEEYKKQYDSYHSGAMAAIDKAIQIVEKLDNTEPERKKGQWEEIRNAYGEIEGWICTCGQEVKCKYNYCPNCGTDMRYEQNDRSRKDI